MHLSHKRLSPTHQSFQNNVVVPPPTVGLMLSVNQFPTPTPTPSLIPIIFCHQTNPKSLEVQMRPSSSPYLILRTLYHRLSISSNILHHHLPSNAKLNFCNLQTTFVESTHRNLGPQHIELLKRSFGSAYRVLSVLLFEEFHLFPLSWE